MKKITQILGATALVCAMFFCAIPAKSETIVRVICCDGKVHYLMALFTEADCTDKAEYESKIKAMAITECGSLDCIKQIKYVDFDEVGTEIELPPSPKP